MDGFAGNFKVKVKRKPRYIKEEDCVGCLLCVDECVFKNAKFDDEFNEGLASANPFTCPSASHAPVVLIDPPSACAWPRASARRNA